MVGNKLFCTFTNQENLDSLVNNLKVSYTILYNKIFVLKLTSNNDFVCTYNIDSFNSNGNVPLNTISVHRKKEFNVLYSLNGLNEIIKSLNKGIVDVNFPIKWINYKNSIILTQNGDLKIFKTKIYKIIEI